MKTLWGCGLVIVLSGAVYNTISGAEDGFWQPLAAMPASPLMPAPAPLLPNHDDNATANLADYLILHDTRNTSISKRATAVAGACS